MVKTKNNRSLETAGRREVKALPYDETVKFLYGIENPHYKNVNRARNVVVSFDDGWAPTIGAGVANTSGAPAEWFEGKPVNKNKVDRFAYNQMKSGDERIRAAYDERHGTPEYPHPSDTLSIGPRLYAAQAKYQRGFLGKHTNAVIDAMASGDSNKIYRAINNVAAEVRDTERINRVKNSRKLYK